MTTKQQGYSLVELIIVMLIILLATAGGLRWHQWQGRQQLQHSAYALRDFLQYQRERANGFNRVIAIHRQGGDSHWCLVAGTGMAQAACDARGHHRYSPPAPGVRLVSLTPGLAFYGLRNTAWPGHIVLANRSGLARVVISGFGRIRLCFPQGGGGC